VAAIDLFSTNHAKYPETGAGFAEISKRYASTTDQMTSGAGITFFANRYDSHAVARTAIRAVRHISAVC
jgi:hypothetical protein